MTIKIRPKCFLALIRHKLRIIHLVLKMKLQGVLRMWFQKKGNAILFDIKNFFCQQQALMVTQTGCEKFGIISARGLINPHLICFGQVWSKHDEL